jgi:thiol:disulfide interchange protein DsbD
MIPLTAHNSCAKKGPSQAVRVWSWVRSSAAIFLIAVGCWLTASHRAAAAPPPDDPFAQASDPGAVKGKNPTDDRIDFQVEVTPAKARPGEVVKLTIKGEPRPGYHTYPLTQRSPDQDESGLSQVIFDETPGLKPLWPWTETRPGSELIPGVGTFLEQKGPFIWTRDILVMPEATPGAKKLSFRIHLQVCDATCVWGDHRFAPEVRVTDGTPIPLSPELRQRLEARAPPIQVITDGTTQGAAGNSAPVKPAPPKQLAPTDPSARPGEAPPPAEEDHSLTGLLLASMGAAIAMLLTPCVFPMIPITVSFFLKQSEHKDHNALVTAAFYSLTIIVVLALAVLLLGQLIVQLANDAWLNLGLGLLLVYFALSLFGMYEIELPSGLTRFTAAREGQGYIGAIFMALTFTVTSFTCTGPFLGPLLVTVKEYQLSFGERVLGAFLYAATFASPFFVLALFPSLLKKLPKSGGWLNAVKVVMGFLELAAALKFLANTDLAWSPGDPLLFNYETVLCAWIALSVACGLYLLGVFRLPHDTPMEHLGVARMLLASIFFGLAVYMVPALWRTTPQGIIGKGLVAFLPLDTRLVPPSAQTGSTELTWLRDYEAAWKQATQEHKLVFIDFTGQNCTNCRYNEKNVFPDPTVHDELSKYVRVQLYTDTVPDAQLSAGEAHAQAKRNSGWQSETFSDVSNPFYAVIQPDPEQPFIDDGAGKQKLKGRVLGTRKGQIKDHQLKDFQDFLGAPLKQQTLRAGL